MDEMKKVSYHSDDHVWIDGKMYMSLGMYNQRLVSISADSTAMCEKIEQLHKENKALRVLLGLPEEGDLGNLVKTETFFDDTEEEELCGFVRTEFKYYGDVEYYHRTSCGHNVSGNLIPPSFKRCPYCGKKIKRLNAEDVIPAYKEGTNE